MALRQHPELIYILHNYDIACQHCIKLRERFFKYFPDLVGQLQEFQELVPSLHIHGHIEDCQFRFNMAYHQGAGRTHGETLEGIWGARKPIGGMTKEMNNGHRHDTLNDFNGDWNWLKVQQIGKC
jgi:Kyakuja-Dileera-Zisupton transposase